MHFFKLASYWFQIAFRLSEEFQIVSSYFRLIQIFLHWQFTSINEDALQTAADGNSQAAESMVQKMSMSDNGKYLSHVVVLNSDEVLSRGLQVVGFSKKNINRVKEKHPLSSTINHHSFTYHFGVSNMVAAQICKDLQTTGVAAANLTVKKPKNPRRMPKELQLLLSSIGFMKQ